MEQTTKTPTVKLNQTAVVKDLVKDPNQKKKQEETLLSEVQLLLEEKTNADRDLLARTGLDTLVVEAEEEQAKVINRIKFREKYLDLPIVTDVEIKRLCAKYNLVWIEAKDYKGAPPPADLMNTLRELDKVAHFSVSDMSIVCTPDATRNVHKQSINAANILQEKRKEEAAERLRRARERDPILFFQIPRTEQYVVCQAWGNDLSPMRAFWNKTLNVFSALFVPAGLLMCFFLATLASKIAKINMFLAVDKNETSNIQTPIIGQIVAFVITLAAGIAFMRFLSGLLYGDYDFTNIRKVVARWKTHRINQENPSRPAPLLFFW